MGIIKSKKKKIRNKEKKYLEATHNWKFLTLQTFLLWMPLWKTSKHLVLPPSRALWKICPKTARAWEGSEGSWHTFPWKKENANYPFWFVEPQERAASNQIASRISCNDVFRNGMNSSLRYEVVNIFLYNGEKKSTIVTCTSVRILLRAAPVLGSSISIT